MNGSLSSVIEPESPPRSALSRELDSFDPVYDSKLCLIGSPGPTIGYHTRLTPADWVHATRENFQYAVSLLSEGSPARVERAFDVLEVLLPRQDTDDASKTYGLWSWYVEEPLDQMNPPDWNWAGFCGLQIGIILVKFPSLLSAPLTAKLEASLGHCVRSIIRRDVKPHYTNIAYLSAAVALMAGDVLNRPDDIKYGREMLGKIEGSLDFHGNYNEFNSPTYTLLLIQFLDQILQTATDAESLVSAERLRCRTWGIIAAYFHPGTAQWAGPQSRSYSVWLESKLVHEISEHVGSIIPCRTPGDERTLGAASITEKLPCPPDIAKRFLALPKDEFELTQRYVRREPDETSTIGTTWFSQDACLGSVNQGWCWIQGRLVLGYWKTEQDLAVQLRMRFLHNGRDFVSAFMRSSQSGRRVLTTLSFLIENGEYHPVFYFPENSEFTTEDFRLRYELLGNGVSAVETGDGRFELRAGGYRTLIQPLDGAFDGQPITWKVSDIEGGVAFDGICYSGPKRTFAFKELGPSYLALGLELLTDRETNPTALPHVCRINGTNSSAAWGRPGSSLHAGFSAVTYRQAWS